MTFAVRMPLRRLFTVTGGATPDSGSPEFWDGDILWVTPEDLGSMDGYWLSDTRRRITQAGFDSCAATAAPEGSIVLTKRAPIGKLAILARQACSNQGCLILVPLGRAESRFYYYWLSVQTPLLQILGRGSTFMELSTQELKALSAPAPLMSEQRAIADSLDRETAKIDALVEKKERLIGLLQEKRTALITHAVTKGLDPDVPIKDSGIEWLGQIPAHWDVWRLKHVSGGLTVGVVVNPSQFVSPSGVPFLRGVDVAEGRIVLDHVQYMSEESSRLHRKSTLRAGDLVSIRVGYPGVTAVVPSELDGSNCASLLITRRSQRVESRVLCYLMNSAIGKAQFSMLQDGAAQEQINVSDAVDFLVPLPPREEQASIGSFVDRETAKIDSLIGKVQEAIERLKEYRTALISAAVTGKIDVRGV